MRNSKPQKMILNNALLEEEFFEEVAILGVVSAFKPYQFVHAVNQGMGFHFVRDHDYEVQINDDYFAVYYVAETIKQTEHFIFTNRNQMSFLLPEVKNVDFIWLIKSASFLKSSKDDIMGVLPQLPVVDYAFEINHEQLKSKQYLII